MSRLLILGASGDQGHAQVLRALAAGHQVRIGLRDPAKGARLFGAAVEAVPLDFADAASLREAMQGIDTVLANFPSSSFNPAEPLLAAAAATGDSARAAGVELILFNTSMPLRTQPLGFAGHDARLAMVDATAQAGVPMVVFNPVVFMGNLLRGWAWPGIARHGRFEYPHAADLDVSWVCQEDLASLMVTAVGRGDLGGRRFAVGGPETLRGADVARSLSHVLGRPIEFVPQEIDAFCAAIRPQLRIADAALRDHMLGELARIYRWYNESPERPFTVDMRPTLAALPVSLTRFEDWAAAQNWQR
jgi:uncharacterized protein YbjT (DUF2867 family)